MMGHYRERRHPSTVDLTVPDRSDKSLQLCFKHRTKHKDVERKGVKPEIFPLLEVVH